jgi:hypothetical protein
MPSGASLQAIERISAKLIKSCVSKSYSRFNSDDCRFLKELHSGLIIAAIATVTVVPIRVNHGQAIFASLNVMAVMAANDPSAPITTGNAEALRQTMTSKRLPSNAPLVRPRSENAAFRTYSTWRLKDATKISATAQNTVERLLNRR